MAFAKPKGSNCLLEKLAVKFLLHVVSKMKILSAIDGSILCMENN